MRRFGRRIKQIHMVGIGGTGMCGIAEVLLTMGYRVTGSDLRQTEVTENLAELGAIVYHGHDPSYVEGAHVVVISSAVRRGNPEVVRAEELKIPVIRRAEMLAELMRMKYGVAVAGTHGKTTTTSMVGHLLQLGGLDPTVIVGGRVKSIGSSARMGEGEILVAEADEFDRSFLQLTPVIGMITTIDAEHLDYYQDLQEITEAFLAFVNKVPFFGTVICCLDDETIQGLLPSIQRPLLTYGLSPQAEVRATRVAFQGLSSRYRLVVDGESLGAVKLQVPGIHNVRNSLGAVAVALELGLEPQLVREALESFTGVHRRFEVKGEVGGVMVVDDYGHHPTEIEVTLRAAKTGWDRRVVAVFQPHLYSRTARLHKEFGRAFFDADMLFITDVYPAREAPIPGVTGEMIARAARASGHRQVRYEAEMNNLVPAILEVIDPGDIILTMGAGDIWHLADCLIEDLPEWAARRGAVEAS